MTHLNGEYNVLWRLPMPCSRYWRLVWWWKGWSSDERAEWHKGKEKLGPKYGDPYGYYCGCEYGHKWRDGEYGVLLWTVMFAERYLKKMAHFLVAKHHEKNRPGNRETIMMCPSWDEVATSRSRASGWNHSLSLPWIMVVAFTITRVRDLETDNHIDTPPLLL